MVNRESALESCGNGVWRAPGACIVDRTGRKRLPIGYSSFDNVAANSVFVDKTRLVAEVLDSGYAVTLFCRPRRFGKSLNLTMLKSFLELPVDGKSRAPLFEGTNVWMDDDGRYRQWQGAYPVISLSMIAAKGLDWKQTYGALQRMIISEYNRHDYLLTSDRLSDNERDYFDRIAGSRASDKEYADSLRQLALMLQKHHGRNVVVLIDEYDAPIMTAYSAPNGGYYDQAVTFLKSWLTNTLKDNDNVLALSCLTGVQRISKESIFSDLNSLNVNTALSTEFEERYGLTADEVSALGEYLGFSDFMDEARDWYDGYRFGRQDVYNPWSVLNYFKQNCEADVYWGNTSGNSVVGELIHNADEETTQKIYSLMQPGGSVSAPLDLGVVFPDLGVRPEAIWSMLYLAGYLTTEDTSRPGRTDLVRQLRIPDLEIAFLYQAEIINRFAAAAGGSDRLADFQKSLSTGDAEDLQTRLTGILRDSVSSFDMVSENSLHMLMTGLCFGVPGYDVPRSNREAGYGRYDLRLEPGNPNSTGFSFIAPKIRPLITLEFKFLGKNECPDDEAALQTALERKAHEALAQIADRGYDAGPLPRYAQGRLRWGIAIGRRHCAVVAQWVDRLD